MGNDVYLGDENGQKLERVQLGMITHPKWVEPNKSKWRRGKRKELKNVMVAMRTLMFGSAYLPGTEFNTAYSALKELHKKMSPKVWGS